MINYNINFIVNKSASIRFCLDTNLKLMECCEDVSMVLLKDNKEYELGRCWLKDKMFILKTILTKTLHNQFLLHPSINKDIGYLYNEDLRFKPGLVYKQLNENECWVGDRHLLWGYEYVMWIYNNADGDIILHFTPVYPGNWTDEGDDEEAEAQVYEAWMATTYKPLWTITLPKETAQLWLRLAENIFSKLH